VILERAVMHVLPGQEGAFESALVEAREVVSAAPGFRSIRVLRGIESTHIYLLLIEWDTVEDHLEGFRGSERYNHWRALLGPHLDGASQVEHYAPVGGG